MQITTEQRAKLVKELSANFAKASGYSANVSDVAQWDVAADALIRTIEGIVMTALQEDEGDHAEDRRATEKAAAG